METPDPPRKCPSGKCGTKPAHGLIKAHKSGLILRCEERGYSLDEVMSCVVEQDGDMWTVDTDHPMYPRYPKEEVQ